MVDDLGLPNLQLLTNAFDQVVRPVPAVNELWHALRGRALSLRGRRPIIGFNDDEKLVLVGDRLPTKVSATEGERRFKEALALERDRSLALSVKEQNQG